MLSSTKGQNKKYQYATIKYISSAFTSWIMGNDVCCPPQKAHSECRKVKEKEKSY